MMLFLVASVLAQNFDCDYANFRIQPASEFAVTFPTHAPLDLSFYAKFINYKGFPVASSAKTTNEGLLETAKWVCLMFNLVAPTVRESMINYNVKMALMARYPQEVTVNIPEHSFLEPAEFWNERARGLGASTNVPTTSAGEENALCDADDRYRGECIVIHEMAHTMTLLSGNPAFLDRMEQTYQSAMSKSLWADTYSTTNSQEYWAEGVQSWFDCNTFRATPDGVHGPISTRDRLKAYDPDLAALIASFFGDTPLRYQCPSNIVVPSATVPVPSNTVTPSNTVVPSNTAVPSTLVTSPVVPPPSITSRIPDTIFSSTNQPRPTNTVSSALGNTANLALSLLLLLV